MAKQTREERRKKEKQYREANKERIAENAKIYRKINKEKAAAHNRAYREANKEKIATAKRAHYNANVEEISRYRRQYYKNNKESERQYYEDNREMYRQYYENNKEKISAATRQYYKDNKKKIAAIKKIYYANNKEKIAVYKRKRRARKFNVNENYTETDKKFTMDLFGNKCFRCNIVQDLCVDHHFPLSKGHALTRTNAVILCRSCNASKHDKLPKDFYTSKELIKVNSILCLAIPSSAVQKCKI